MREGEILGAVDPRELWMPGCSSTGSTGQALTARPPNSPHDATRSLSMV